MSLQYGAMVLRIRKYPDDILRNKAEEIGEITENICKLSEDMIETMAAAKGVGLAANQVGVPLRIVVVETGTEKQSRPLVVINPMILKIEDIEAAEEGCLSVPGFYELVKRGKKAQVKGKDLSGKGMILECEGLMARAFQHEVDHLNGILFVDYLSPIKKQIFRREYLKEKK
jgi:peptide deformylase